MGRLRGRGEGLEEQCRQREAQLAERAEELAAAEAKIEVSNGSLLGH